MRKPSFGNAMAQIFENKSQSARANYCEPKRIYHFYLHTRARNPKKTAKNAVEIIGTPGTK